MFTYETRIFLRQTDAAGVIFFGEQFSLAADAYQAFLDDIGMSTRRLLDEGEIQIPVVHTEADLKAPMRLDDKVSIELTLSRLGATSYTTEYRLECKGREVGTVQCVHVVIDAATGQKRDIPEELRDALAAHLVTVN